MSDSVFMGAIQAGLVGAGIGFVKGMADRMDVVAAGTVAIWNRLGDLEDGIHGLHQEARRQADAAEATAGAAVEANLRAASEARQSDISDTTRAYHAFCQKAVAVGMATQVQCRLFQELGADGTTLIGLIEGLAHEPSGLSAEGQHRARQAVMDDIGPAVESAWLSFSASLEDLIGPPIVPELPAAPGPREVDSVAIGLLKAREDYNKVRIGALQKIAVRRGGLLWLAEELFTRARKLAGMLSERCQYLWPYEGRVLLLHHLLRQDWVGSLMREDEGSWPDGSPEPSTAEIGELLTADVADELTGRILWVTAQAGACSPADLYHMSIACRFGVVLGKDERRAWGLAEDAAERGHIEAMFRLGEACAQGLGRPTDIAKAFKWHQRAALAGSSLDQFIVGKAWAQGDGVEEDPDEGFRWMKVAASDPGKAAKPAMTGDILLDQANASFLQQSRQAGASLASKHLQDTP